MEILILIILACVFGCGITSYYLGRRVGIEDTVTHLVDEGIIVLDED